MTKIKAVKIAANFHGPCENLEALVVEERKAGLNSGAREAAMSCRLSLLTASSVSDIALT
jgi:cytochrome c551/c552